MALTLSLARGWRGVYESSKGIGRHLHVEIVPVHRVLPRFRNTFGMLYLVQAVDHPLLPHFDLSLGGSSTLLALVTTGLLGLRGLSCFGVSRFCFALFSILIFF